MKKYLPLLCLTLIISAGLGAETIDLNQARLLALQNSRDMARVNATVQTSVMNERDYTYYPKFSLGLSAGATLLDWKQGFSADVITGTMSAGANAGITQNIFVWNGGREAISREINRLSTESARQGVLETYFSVLSSVDSAYYAVLEAEASLESAELSLQTAELSLAIAEIRRANGMLSVTEYLNAQAEKESKEVSRTQSRSSLQLAKIRLNNLLGISVTVDLVPVDFDALEPLMQTLARLDDAGFESLYTNFRRYIASRNPALIKAGIASTIAEKNMNMTRREYLPTFSASANAGLTYTVNKASISDPLKGLGGNLDVSLRLTIPLDFWSKNNAMQRQKISMERSAMDYSSEIETFDLKLRTCLLSLVSNAAQVLSSTRALEYSTMSFNQVLELYRLGQSSQSNMSGAEVAFRSSRNTYDRTRFSFLSELSNLRSLGLFENDAEIAMLFSELNIN